MIGGSSLGEDNMTVLLLAGMPGAGKEEFLKIARKEGYEIVRMGDVVRRTAEQKGIKAENIGDFADEERKKHHEGIWADRTSAYVKEDKTVIDGIRSRIEVTIFKCDLDRRAKVVAIHASPDTRFHRLKNRNREDAPEDRDEFRDRDDRELDWGLGRVIAMADLMLVNEGSLAEFHEKCKKTISSSVEDADKDR